MGNRASAAEAFTYDQRSLISPFRYPGGKRRLAPYVAATLRANELKPALFVEPYAGGASVGLELLASGLVERLALCDADPMVAAFWQTLFLDEGGADWLCRRVESIDLDLKTWEKMKYTRWKTPRNLALAGLYLNRTSFNGSLYHSAGPIGGKSQAGTYKVGARFNREVIVKRLRACAALSEGVVSVQCDDAMRELNRLRKSAARQEWDIFVYLDPPFWAKAKYLYSRWFTELEHEELAEQLKFVSEPWLLSYDAAQEVVDLYAEHTKAQVANVQLYYSGAGKAAGNEIVITNLAHLPPDKRMYRTNEERAARQHVKQKASEVLPTVQASNRNG